MKRKIQAINVGAGGHASDMIGRLRMNNSALRGKKYFQKAKNEYHIASRQTSIDLKSASHEELHQIRLQVLENRKKSRVRLLLATFLTLVLGVMVLWGLWELIHMLGKGQIF